MSQHPRSDAVMPRWMTRLIRGLVGSILFCMMLLIFLDVFFRYLFDSPLPGSFEIVQFLLALLIFSALPLVTAAQDHISVGIFDRWFTGKLSRIQKVLVGLVNCFSVALIAYLLLRQGQVLDRYQQVTGDLELPMGLLAYAMCFLAAASFIVQVLVLWRNPPRSHADSLENDL